MAKQTINVGSTANDGTGDKLRDAFVKVNANFTELYSDDAGDVNSVNGQTGVVVLDSDDIAEGSSNLYNQTHVGDVTGATVLSIASGAVDYDNLGVEFKSRGAISSNNVNFSTAQVFTKTLSGATTFTYSGTEVGMVKDLIINANGNTFTLPTGTKIIAGTPTTGINFIQVVVTDTAEFYTSISQAQ